MKNTPSKNPAPSTAAAAGGELKVVPRTTHVSYPTRKEALRQLLRDTYWNPGIYLAIFPDGAGGFFYTTNEKESFDIQDDFRAKGIKYYPVDDSDKDFDQFVDKCYKAELRSAFDRLVPRWHPEHKSLWKKHFSDLSMCADGYGGYCDPQAMVEGWVESLEEGDL